MEKPRRLLQQKAEEYNEIFSSFKAEEILAFLFKNHPGKATFSSSMGAEDQAMTHMMATIDNNPSIFTLDTGRLFYETYELIEKTNARYGINIRIFFPRAEKVEAMVNEKGVNLFYKSIENRKLCCGIRKIEPLQRALKGYEVWITGLRSEQSMTRSGLKKAEWDEGNQIIKVNPLLDWSEKQMWDFIKQHQIPYNALHDKGFPSIGCRPCTRAVLPGEDIRAGRWWWEKPESKECGLHSGKKAE